MEGLSYWLRQSGLFNHISDALLSEVSRRFERVRYEKGDIILKEGDLGDAFYIIEHGRVFVYVLDYETGDEIILARLESGGYFGEQALLSNEPKPRNATVKAMSDVSLLKISRDQLTEMMHFDIALHEKLSDVDLARQSDVSGKNKQ